jgi:four helix bundle protein
MTRLATSFTQLEVHTKACRLADDIFQISKRFPPQETYALTHQLRKASRSIGAQIAEAWGKRRYRRHFFSKLTDADAEQLETQHWLRLAHACGYLTAEQARELTARAAEIGKMLNVMMKKSDDFCSK